MAYHLHLALTNRTTALSHSDSAAFCTYMLWILKFGWNMAEWIIHFLPTFEQLFELWINPCICRYPTHFVVSCWMEHLYLIACDNIKHKKGHDNVVADALFQAFSSLFKVKINKHSVCISWLGVLHVPMGNGVTANTCQHVLCCCSDSLCRNSTCSSSLVLLVDWWIGTYRHIHLGV